MRAAVFDLGDTLLEYEGLPLSWEVHYSAAIQALADVIGIAPSAVQITAACTALRRFNTRLYPRTDEVRFADDILPVLTETLGYFCPANADAVTEAFFSVFRQRLRCFPESVERLVRFRREGVRTGILTDVPYGMPRRLVLEDIVASGILPLIDDVVTSVDAGARKPSTAGLALLATHLEVEPSEIMYVGNEKKDVEVALAFGCEAVLIQRVGQAPDWGQHRTISNLDRL
jgi:putative hydrolase of the HAD superfamily